MVRRVYIWKDEHALPASSSIKIEVPLDSKTPTFVSAENKLFQYTGTLFKGLPLYIEIEPEM